MNLQTSLSQRAEQRMAMLPRMLQSIEVLQMAAGELLELVDRELESNETLELMGEVGAAGSGELDGESGHPQAEREERERDRLADYRVGSAGSGEEDRKQMFLQNVPGQGPGLREALLEQLSWSGLDDELAETVRILVDQLDGDGLLQVPEDRLALLLPRPELLPEGLAILRTLEPTGVGGRDPIHAMLLQIPQTDPDRPWLVALLTRHLQDLARNKLPQVAQALGVSLAELQQLIARLRRLHPRPGAAFREESAQALHPDVEVHLDRGRVEVLVDDATLPELGINPEYLAMSRARDTTTEVRRYLRGKVRSARDLIDAVAQRRETLARVVAELMSHQRRFLESGRTAIRPLRMADLAERLGLHTSTVSRAIAGKSVQTPHGILPLRTFFDGGALGGGAHGGAGSGAVGSGDTGTGRVAVQERIRALVAGEDPEAPLSDDALVQQLADQGVRVARRTVTKYRKELAIPSSWRRRRHGG